MILDSPSSARTLSGRFAIVSATVLPPPIELSVVMSSLDEAETLGTCITRARRALDAAGMTGEIIVADNGSADGSVLLARTLGARVVLFSDHGRGSTLMRAVEAARGRYILMGDADGTYDFGELPKFVHKLREGYDLVQGCSLRGKGGTVARAAMPSLHRWLGRALFTLKARRRLEEPMDDAHCRMRAFSKELYLRLDPRVSGMEFASEDMSRSRFHGARCAEVLITLQRDHRVSRSTSPGWRRARS